MHRRSVQVPPPEQPPIEPKMAGFPVNSSNLNVNWGMPVTPQIQNIFPTKFGVTPSYNSV